MSVADGGKNGRTHDPDGLESLKARSYVIRYSAVKAKSKRRKSMPVSAPSLKPESKPDSRASSSIDPRAFSVAYERAPSHERSISDNSRFKSVRNVAALSKEEEVQNLNELKGYCFERI